MITTLTAFSASQLEAALSHILNPLPCSYPGRVRAFGGSGSDLLNRSHGSARDEVAAPDVLDAHSRTRTGTPYAFASLAPLNNPSTRTRPRALADSAKYVTLAVRPSVRHWASFDTVQRNRVCGRAHRQLGLTHRAGVRPQCSHSRRARCLVLLASWLQSMPGRSPQHAALPGRRPPQGL